ncbi:MAG TPA: ABC transporter substrate-binding protein, partial [Caldilinea sp.]|nr:ABC transporter substrate-binding protein [Caldilinea sp.]
MKFRTRTLIFLTLILGLALSACAPLPAQLAASDEPAAPASESVKLGLGFIPSIQFAPYYVGIEKGFFQDAGIELELSYGFENDYLKLVGIDEYQFMVGSGDQVVLGRAQGLPVRYVLNWYTRFPVVIFSKADRAITQPAELADKTVGIPGAFGASYVALRGILEAAGLTEQDIRLESIGFTQAAAVSEDKVDAAVDYAVNGPVVLALAGTPTNQIALDDYLVIPANGLVTNEKTIAERPELVQALVRATQQAIAYTLANPDEAFAIALKAVPEAGGDNEAASRAVFDASLAFWAPRAGQTPGATEEADWQAAAAFMQRIGLVDSVVPADSL